MSDPKNQQTEAKAYTVVHFMELARQNRFAENGTIPHASSRCLVCHPDQGVEPPFSIYLEVIRESVKVRRPRLDAELVAAINSDLELMGETARVEYAALAKGDPKAVSIWKNWLRDAIDTGLGLLSIHSESCLEFNLEEAEEEGWGERIERTVQDLMEHQKRNRIAP